MDGERVASHARTLGFLRRSLLDKGPVVRWVGIARVSPFGATSTMAFLRRAWRNKQQIEEIRH